MVDSTPFINEISKAAILLSQARHAIIFTGAGVSTPSGIPDFRGEKEGLWKRYDPMRVASRTTFFRTPEIFYDWFRPLFMTSWKAEPNAAHQGMAKLEKTGLAKAILTQNIDGLHQKCGAKNVLELHGSAMSFACPACRFEAKAEEVFTLFETGQDMPLCRKCGSILKPDVVLFEEQLPGDVWKAAEQESHKADVILVSGSSLEVFPACTIPQNAVAHGCTLILNNLSSTPLDHLASCLIRRDTALFFPQLLEQLQM